MPDPVLTPPEPLAAQPKAASAPLPDVLPGDESKALPKNEAKLTPEEAQKNIDEILSGLQTNAAPEKKKEKDEIKPEAKPEPEKPAEEQIEPAAEEKPKKKPLKPKPQEVPLDVQKLAEVATAAATKAATEAVAGRDQSSTAAIDKAPEIPEALKVYAEMAKINPQKYANLVEEAKASLEEIEIYKKDWRKNNPGQKFNPKADEHEEFFQKVEPQYDDDDYDDARIELRMVEKLAERDTVQQARMDKLEAKATVSELDPVANQVSLESINSVITAIFEKEIEGKTVTPDLVKKLAEENPEAAKLLRDAAEVIVPFNREVIRLFNSNGVYKYDEANTAHLYISDFAAASEQNIAAAPVEETTRSDGRKFATRGAFAVMTPSQKAQHWQIGRDELIQLHTFETVQKAKKLSAEEDQKYQAWEKRRNSRNGHATTSTQAITKETQDTAKPVVVKIDSPEGGGRSTVPINETGGAGQPLNSRELLLKALQS